jgi:outer membrane protein OmpA-like peptidoglycan-associated protein
MPLRWLVALAAALLPAASFAQAKPADVAGGKDHSLVSRFAGSQMDGYQELAFERGTFFLPDPSAPAKELDRDKPLVVEGRVTRLLYIAPKGKTPLEVHRNYQQALQFAGAAMKTAVDGRGAWWDTGGHWRANFEGLKFQGRWAPDISPFSSNDGLYVYGVVSRGGAVWHVSVLTAQVLGVQEPQAAVAVQIVEPVAVQTGQVVVNADAMRQGLNGEGKIALYGVYFDTGKSELKPESKAQLDEMAKLLQAHAALRVFIVGHTDNQGALEANLALSRARAQAVVDALVKVYKVDARRLGAAGVANYAPAATNASDGGRAKNRRVELVAQ